MNLLPHDDIDAQTIPLSKQQADELRARAKHDHYPANKIHALLADIGEIDSTLSYSTARTPEQMTQVQRRYALLEQLDREKQKAISSFLSMLALAIKNRPTELAEILTPFIADAVSKAWEQLDKRVENLETIATAQMEYAQ